MAGIEDSSEAHAHREGIDHEPSQVLRGSQNMAIAEQEIRTLSRMWEPLEGIMAMFDPLVPTLRDSRGDEGAPSSFMSSSVMW